VSTTCPVCAAPLERRPRAVGEVVVGAVSAVVEGAPVLVCPEGHHREELRSDLDSLLEQEVREAVLASRKPLLRRQLRCGDCDAELTVPGRRTQRSVSARVQGLGVVRVTFDLPMLRCPSCGLEQLPRKVADEDVPSAIRQALG
jgi:hypothetical protein